MPKFGHNTLSALTLVVALNACGGQERNSGSAPAGTSIGKDASGGSAEARDGAVAPAVDSSSPLPDAAAPDGASAERADVAPGLADTAPDIADTAPALADTAPDIADTAPVLTLDVAPDLADVATDLANDGSVPTSEVAAMQAQLAKSRAQWVALRTQRGAAYDYLSTWRVYPFGGEFQTRIEVRDDKVVKRTFGISTSPPEWVETGTEVGSHASDDSPFGFLAPAITIDALYDRCAAEVIPRHSKDVTVTLSFHPSGIVGNCTYRSRNCADSCDSGYRVSQLLLPPP